MNSKKNYNNQRGDSFEQSRRFRHGQILPIEFMPSVIDALKAVAVSKGTSLFHEIRCAVYQYLDREAPDLRPSCAEPQPMTEALRPTKW